MERLLDLFGISDTALRQGAISGLFSFFGVLITGLIAILTWVGNRAAANRERRRTRDDRKRDLRWAFWSEIDAVWRQWIVAGDLETMLATAALRFEEDAAYTPFITAETGVALFEIFAAELPLLDGEEVAPIVAFYRQLRLIERFALDLRGENYSGFTPNQKHALFAAYLTMIDHARGSAELCLSALEARLGFKWDRRVGERRSQILNNKAKGHTGPASGARAVQGPAQDGTDRRD